MPDITRPPTPKISTNAPSLYRMLVDLHAWVEHEREELPDDAKPMLAKVAPPGSGEAYCLLPIRSLAYHHSVMIEIARAWDHNARIHDDCYEEACSVRTRLYLLGITAQMLNGAFVTSELREAIAGREMANLQHLFEGISNWYLGAYDESRLEAAQAQAQAGTGGDSGDPQGP